MKLSDYELIILEQLHSASRKEREPKDVINDCRDATTAMLQHFCLYDCGLKEDSKEFKKSWGYLTYDHSFFHGEYPNTKLTYKSSKKNIYIKIRYGIKKIKDARQGLAYKKKVSDKDGANLILLTLKEICKYYFHEIRNYQLKSIKNIPKQYHDSLESMLQTNERFEQIKKKRTQDSEEIIYETIIRQRPILYVLVLIDASSSMLWPFLKNQENATNPFSEDYKQAVKKVQETIKKSHIKALTALRGSRDCQQRNLKVCQYIFNHEIQPLNAPVILDKDKMDEVKILSPKNYYPDGMTALYDVIEQSTRLVSEKYIMPSKKNMEVDKLILVVITDGEDTYVNNTEKYIRGTDRKWKIQEAYSRHKKAKINKIRQIFKTLRGQENFGQKHLETALIIGLTNNQFPKETLEELQNELGFNESISIDQNDEQALRRAFSLFSSNALNT